jgi:hypothetical protein
MKERKSDSIILQRYGAQNVTAQPIQYCILCFCVSVLGLPRHSANFGRILVPEC